MRYQLFREVTIMQGVKTHLKESRLCYFSRSEPLLKGDSGDKLSVILPMDFRAP